MTFAILTRSLHLWGFLIRKCMGVSLGREKVTCYNKVTARQGSAVD